MSYKKLIPHRLSTKFIAVASIALLISLCIFQFVYEWMFNQFIDSKWFKTHWNIESSIMLEDYRAYINSAGLTVDEAIRDKKWRQDHQEVYLYLEEYDPNNLYMEHENEEIIGQYVLCTDGTLYAWFYPSYGYYARIWKAAAFISAFACFFLVLIPYVFRIIKRIECLSREMEIIAGGELSYQIYTPGSDEISQLGQNIESMRCAILEQMQHENEAILANSQLITSLSHDLRTPLTKLTGYLEILLYKKYKQNSEVNDYLQKALEKSRQMQLLSDKMFRNFTIKENCAEEPQESISGSILLQQLIAEQCYDLQADGFEISPPIIDYDFIFYGSPDDMQRIFDNLFSNIKKYSDKSFPVEISVIDLCTEVQIVITNHIFKSNIADSHGIGIRTVERLLKRNHGRLEIQNNGTTYCSVVYILKGTT